MSFVHVLVNPLSGNGFKMDVFELIAGYFPDAKARYIDITTISDCKEFLERLEPNDSIVICGGDGTLNHFINQTFGVSFQNSLYYYPTGSGNDFLRDLEKTSQDGPIKINEYIHDLPCVCVNGQTYRFLNGVGYGIDGYCCEVGDQLRKKGKKPDYTAIAIKGLLFHYKPTDATVVVDGTEYAYHRVWIAPTMHGRYYGGGMMPAPAQLRNNTKGKLSLMVMHNAGKIGTLCVFPSIFRGEHVKRSKVVAVHEGTDITVRFDRPVTLQIDGEVITNVSEYRAYSKVPAKIN